MNVTDARRYSLLSLVIASMRQVIDGCDFLLQNGTASQNLQQIIITGIVATYFKPFTDNGGAGRVQLNGFSLDHSQQQLHAHLATARNKIYAHTDFQFNFATSQGDFSHEPHVRIANGNTHHDFVQFSLWPNAASEIKMLAEEILTQATSQAHTLINGEGLAPGRFRLALDLIKIEE
jgi:hypothetical protein